MVDGYTYCTSFVGISDSKTKNCRVFMCGVFTSIMWNKPVQNSYFGTWDCTGVLYNAKIKA